MKKYFLFRPHFYMSLSALTGLSHGHKFSKKKRYCLRRPQKFFQKGASDVSIIYWIKYNLTAANRILLKDLNQKLKWFCSKDVAIGWHVEQTDAIQMYYWRGSGGKAPSRWAIFTIFWKNNHFTVIWITFRTFLRPLERTKLLRLGIYLKFLNRPAFSALFISRSNSNHVKTLA